MRDADTRDDLRELSALMNAVNASHRRKVEARREAIIGKKYTMPAGTASFVRNDGTVVDLGECGPMDVYIKRGRL